MIISIPVIIALGVLLLLAVVTPLFSPFRRVKGLLNNEDTEEDSSAELPQVSIVLAEHDCSFYLQKVLPRYLSQDYPADRYQVVVVIDQSDTQSEDYLKILSEQYPQLYYTKLPDSSRYVSRKKLGLTLGLRAVRFDWVLIADVDCRPSSDGWLAAMARHATAERNMVIGMTPYEYDSPRYYRFEHLRTMLYHLHSAWSGQPFSTNQSVVMLRRSEFFEKKGFLGNLEFARAEYEFLVNKFGAEGKCGIAIEPESWLEQYEPTSEYWTMKRLYAIDALKGLQRAAWFKTKFKTDLMLMHVYNVLTLIVMACGGVLAAVQYGAIPAELPAVIKAAVLQYDGLALAGGSALLWIISLIERCCIYSSVLEYFGSVGSLSAVIMEWGINLRNAVLRVRYMFADKTDFITHKL